MQPSTEVSRLIEIMRALRDPATGCPWDLEQSFDTIVPYTIEEAHEVADAIERRDADDLCDELGDLLLQVVFHAQLASEAGLFSFEDVVRAITTKMVRRHPHVFGDENARTAKSAKDQWNRIKAEEKLARAQARQRRAATTSTGEWRARTEPTGHLDAVPGAFPSLMLAVKVQQRAATVGFDWTETPPILAKLREETDEFETALANGSADECQDELGDILFTVANLARRMAIDPDMALRGTVAKFRRRFAVMETLAKQDDRPLNDRSLEELEQLWVEAKRDERQAAV